MGPIDYTLQVVDPINAALQQRGLRFQEEQDLAAGQRADRGLDMEQQRLDMAQQQMAMEQAEAARVRQEQEAAIARERAGQEAFIGLMFDDNITPEKVMGAVRANPEMAQPIMEFWQGRNAQQAESELNFGKQVVFAIGQSPEQAAVLLEQRALAAENAGDKQTADTYRSQAQMARSGPEGAAAVRAQGLMVLAGKMPPKDFAEMLKAYGLSKEEDEPLSNIGKIEADFRAGRISEEAYKSELAKNAPKGSKISVGPDGSVTITEGVGVGTSGDVTVGQAYNPAEVQSTLALIDEIKRDENLARVTGPIEGGGGNDVETFNVAKRAYYGSGGLALIEKMNQLQSRSWLAARDMLKGGGPITDYESRKAEAAVARLSRTKDEAEFKAALKDLEDAIRDGLKKLEAAKTGNPSPQQPDDAAFLRAMMEKAKRGEPLTPEEGARYYEVRQRMKGGQ